MNLLVCMKSFLAVVDHNGFTNAAKNIYISAPNISKQVAFLEDWLGGDLLIRTTRKVDLTSLGESFYPEAKRMLAEIKQTKNFAKQNEVEPAGLLRLSVAPIFARKKILPIVIKFMRRYENTSIEIIDCIRNTSLLAEKADISILGTNFIDPLMKREHIYDDTFYYVATEQYLKKYGKPKTPHDLTTHRCLINTNKVNANLWEFKNNIVVRVNGVLYSDNGDLLIIAAKQNMGIMLVSSYAIEEDVSKKRLIPVLDKFKLDYNKIYAYYEKSAETKLLVKKFLEILKKDLR